MYYVKTTISKRVTRRFYATMAISIGPFPKIIDAYAYCNNRRIDTQEQNIISTSPQCQVVIKPAQIRQ